MNASVFAHSAERLSPCERSEPYITQFL